MKAEKMRSVSIRNGVARLWLWEGTEDEESFPIKSLKRGTPYVKAYGVKYELTAKEAQVARQMSNLF